MVETQPAFEILGQTQQLARIVFPLAAAAVAESSGYFPRVCIWRPIQGARFLG